MTKYMHLIDNEEYDEDEVRDVIMDNLDDDNLIEVLNDRIETYGLRWLLSRLDERTLDELVEPAIENYFENYFSTIESEEEE